MHARGTKQPEAEEVLLTSQGESAVLVLAAGAGTRMRSDTPKVLHPLAGRSMLAHSLHAIAKMAPQHLVVVLGQDHGQIEQVVGELAGTVGRSIDVAIQDQQLGTGHAVLCGLSALPDDFGGVVVVTSGDIPLLDADTLADLVAVHSWFTAHGWKFSTSAPLDTSSRDVAAVTQKLADHFARNIAAHPADWHMMQPQWLADLSDERRAKLESG